MDYINCIIFYATKKPLSHRQALQIIMIFLINKLIWVKSQIILNETLSTRLRDIFLIFILLSYKSVLPSQPPIILGLTTF